MRISATVVLLLLLFSFDGLGQSELTSQYYGVGGIVVVPHAQNQNQIDVRLTSDSGVQIGRAIIYPQSRFAFHNIPRGTYYLTVDLMGFKPVRQRVDASGFDAGFSQTIILDPVEEVRAAKPLDLVGEGGSIDVSQMVQNQKPLKYLGEAEKKLKQGAISDARRQLESIVQGIPDSYDAHRLLGTAYQQSRRYEDAEKEYRAAQTLRPRSAVPLVSLASLYLEQIENGAATPEASGRMLIETRSALAQAIKMSPDAAYAHYLLGVAYHKSSMDRESERSFRSALELEPRLGQAHLGLANLYIRGRRWSAALAELDVYLKDNPRIAGREQIVNKRDQVDRAAKEDGPATTQR